MPRSLYNNCEKGDEMYYELYVDSLFLVNFVMNLYLLLLVDRSLFRTATRRRLILGAGAGALLYFLPFFLKDPLWLRAILGIPSGCIVMIAVAFRVRSVRAFARILERLLLYSVLMGGSMLLVLKLFPRLREHLVGVWGVLGMGAVLYLLFDSLRARNGPGDGGLCRVTMINGGNRMTVAALLDSGNSLIEPVSGKPVSIVERDIVLGLWKEEPRYYRAIPYHSIGRRRGILKGYLLPELQIELGGVVKNCGETYIAVCEDYITEGKNDGDTPVKMILNPLLLKQEKSPEAS